MRDRLASPNTPCASVCPLFSPPKQYTKAFQIIMNAYGIPHYEEVNPAIFALISFPFLFAVMFGDVGHGFIMAAFAAVCILKEQSIIASKSSNEMWVTIFQVRTKREREWLVCIGSWRFSPADLRDGYLVHIRSLEVTSSGLQRQMFGHILGLGDHGLQDRERPRLARRSKHLSFFVMLAMV